VLDATDELVAHVYRPVPTNSPVDADAEAVHISRLFAAARDHALIARLLCSGKMRWEPFKYGSGPGIDGSGELCFDGMRHSTELDEFGVPRMTGHLRAEIEKAERAKS